MSPISNQPSHQVRHRTLVILAATATVLGVSLSGCKTDDDGTRVAGWSLVEPTQRHPIMVSQQPTTISLRVARGAYGLSPQQKSQVISFLERYRSADAGNSKLVIEAPSGSPNEVSSMQAVAEIRALVSDIGYDASNVAVEAVHTGGDQPPIRISYLRYVAEAPECGRWPSNLAETETNLSYPNLGCAQQRNLAAMVANPADLLGPRGTMPAARERRDVAWDKYVKGESTISGKQEDEKVKVKGSN